MRKLVLAAAAIATLLPVAGASAQGWGHNGREVRAAQRECRREIREARRDDRRDWRQDRRDHRRDWDRRHWNYRR